MAAATECKYLHVIDGQLRFDEKAWTEAAIPFAKVAKEDGDALVKCVEEAIKAKNPVVAQGAHDRYVAYCVANDLPQLNIEWDLTKQPGYEAPEEAQEQKQEA